MAYESITNFIVNRGYEDLIAMSPYEVYNLPYDIAVKIWESLGGLIAWLINLIFPNNGVSQWLISDPVTNGFGFLQCLGDGLKTFMKENVVPKAIDKKIYWWGLSLVIGTSVLLACMVPLSNRWFIVDYQAGLLIIFALFALAPFLILCAGWAQNNKYSLIGGLRAAELMISYEIPMLILLAGTVLMAGSFNINDIVAYQEEHIWFVIPQIIGFFTCIVCAVAESERVPFDLSEAEAELVEGWQTEYAGMKWGLIMLGDYFRGYVACALVVFMYLGGWSLPVIGGEAWYLQYFPEIVFLLKVALVFFIFVLARAALPRVRTDQILNVGWKSLMPLSVINLAIVILLKVTGVM